MSNKLVKRWEYTTNQILKLFLTRYFELGDELYKSDYYWIGNEVGGVCNYGDYYINFNDMLYCLNNDVPIKKFFEWYDWCLETEEFMNLKSFMMGASKVKELEEKHLEDLRLKVTRAEEELKEALKNYGSNNKE